MRSLVAVSLDIRSRDITRDEEELIGQCLRNVRQKQIALDHATAEWVLLLDADEQATYDLGREMEAAVSSSGAADGYRIKRVLYHLGHYYTRPIYRDRPVRLFRRDRGHIGGVDPHDKVI